MRKYFYSADFQTNDSLCHNGMLACLLACFMHAHISTDKHRRTNTHISRITFDDGKVIIMDKGDGVEGKHLFLEKKIAVDFYWSKHFFSTSFPFYSSKRQFNQAQNL